MQSTGTMQALRGAAWKTWLGAALALWLLLAESFAFAHQLDTAAHDNGQACAVCIGAATFGAGAVSVPLTFEPTLAPTAVVAAAFVAFSSVTPTRRYARGPPAVSF